MLETRAVVVQLDGVDAIVEARQGSGCGHCQGGQGCGSGKLSQLFCVQPRRFRVRNEINAGIGEEVQVSVADGALLRSALILYVLPLLLLLGGGMLGAQWGDVASRDASAAVGALIGLVAGFALARLLARQPVLSGARPVIARCGNVHHCST